MDRKDVNLNKAFKKLYNVFLESMERNYLENIQDKAYRKEQRSYHRGELDDTLRLIGTRDVKQ
ncbi:hypothetical protein GQ42DRAFT_166120 [Ramicandelaber brevisporus]|nr:hypothetical protein GQ42DRAFT_166120 [Ramicandelaber brevisporus]